MSSQFLSLEEAATKLGITTDRLVELRSQGKIRGFRDGASWKFPDAEIERLADDLASESGDYNPFATLDAELSDEDSDEFGIAGSSSGILAGDLEGGSSIASRSSGKIIGGDPGSDKGSGSDIELGGELVRGGSDVNLVPGGVGSDVKIVAGNKSSDSDDFALSGIDDGLVEIDSGELKLSLDEPAITHDSGELDLALDPNAGSTGPITDKELEEMANSDPDKMRGRKKVASESGLQFDDDDEDSDDDVIGGADDDDDDLAAMLSDSISADSDRPSRPSSLELMDDLDLGSSPSGLGSRSSRGVDVLSELDLLSADVGGSGLISGDSGNVLGSSDLGSGLGLKSGKGGSSKGSGLNFDDALASDDDLVIADDEDDLVLGGSASDVALSGDSGMNLMSPSDSGLSLESEPLDLQGSSISALDLSAELGSDIGSGSGGSIKGSKVSGISLEKDEDFRLSPSGIAIETDADSSSQVIDIEDSAAFAGGNDPFGGDPFGDAVPVEQGFEAEAVVDGLDGGGAQDEMLEEPMTATRARAGAVPSYEVPYNAIQVSTLLITVLIMCIGGMLMTDLMRNMWAYTPIEAPVSSMTDALIDLAQLKGTP